MKKKRATLWKERLSLWKTSGKSGLEYTKQQHISYPTFCYWRRKLADLTAKPFVELVDISHTPKKLFLEWQGVAIRLSNHFDVHTLKRFLQVLQEL